eukprot:gene4049-7338_t
MSHFNQEHFENLLTECKVKIIAENSKDIFETFQEQLSKEVTLLNEIYMTKEKEIFLLVEKLYETVEDSESVISPRSNQKNKNHLLHEISKRLENLKDFSYKNVSIITKTIKKYDRELTGFHFYQKIMPQIKKYQIYSSQNIEVIESKINTKTDEFAKRNISRTEKPIIVKNFNIENLEKGRIHHIWVPIITSTTGEMVSVPVIVAKGLKTGPVLGLTCSVHGDETKGITIFHKIFSKLEINDLSGSLVGILANPIGYKSCQKLFVDGADLNQLFPGKLDGCESEIYAHNFFHHVVSQLEYLIDLHTLEYARVISYHVRAHMQDKTCSDMALLQNADIILPDNTSISKGSLVEAAMKIGIKGIYVSFGDSTKTIERLEKVFIDSTWKTMNYLKMLPLEEDSIPSVTPVICQDYKWLHSDVGGILNVLPNLNQQLKKGDLLAQVKSVFGNVIKEYRAEETAIEIKLC